MRLCQKARKPLRQTEEVIMLKKIIIMVAPVILLAAILTSYFYTSSQATKQPMKPKKQVMVKQSKLPPAPKKLAPPVSIVTKPPSIPEVKAAEPKPKIVKKKPAHKSSIESTILANTQGLKKDVLEHALTGYHWAISHGYVSNPDILTIVDFSKPSYQKRMWVVNIKSGKELMNLYTTHGRNSGMTSATTFSNRSGSKESSVGVFVTMNPYRGKHGLSVRLKGLEPGINSHAYARAIVVHPAWYATPSYISARHRAGRSWGCFALDPAKSSKYVNLTKDGTVFYAYGKPEEHDPVVA